MSSTDAGKAPSCALQELEELWSDLEDHERFKFQSLCAFFETSWKEHASTWTTAETEYFLHSFETFLSERVGEAGCRPLRGLGRSKLVEHDPRADALRVSKLLTSEMMLAYCERFARAWRPSA